MGEKRAHMQGDGGPLTCPVLLDESQDDFVLLRDSGSTSGVHSRRSVIPYKRLLRYSYRLYKESRVSKWKKDKGHLIGIFSVGWMCLVVYN